MPARADLVFFLDRFAVARPDIVLLFKTLRIPEASLCDHKRDHRRKIYSLSMAGVGFTKFSLDCVTTNHVTAILIRSQLHCSNSIKCQFNSIQTFSSKCLFNGNGSQTHSKWAPEFNADHIGQFHFHRRKRSLETSCIYLLLVCQPSLFMYLNNGRGRKNP